MKRGETIKVLLISHNPFSTYQNMGKTFLSLFSSFDKSELCQIYIYPSVPDVNVVNAAYRITDIDAIKSFFFKKKVGREIKACSAYENLIESVVEGAIYSKQSNRMPIKDILRDLVWKISNWYSVQLQEWLDRENPTCIFLAPGYAKFIYEIAIRISKDRGIPIITYICDDYYFVEPPKTLVGKIQLVLLKKKINGLMKDTQKIIGICDDICELYSSEFNVEATTIMTGASFESARTEKIVDSVHSISYFGNIGCGRYVSLAEIGKCLDEINSENETQYKLKIYTAESDEKMLNKLKQNEAIELKGFITGDEFKKEFFSSDLLLHVEGFDKESIDKTRHSISTKIADCLASGIPLIAIGPENLASMKHLKNNKCAYVITSELKKGISEALFLKKDQYEKISRAAIESSKKFHQTHKNSQKLKKILEEYHE